MINIRESSPKDADFINLKLASLYISELSREFKDVELSSVIKFVETISQTMKPTKRFIVSIDRSKIGCFTIVDKGEKREKIPLNIIANASETAFGSNIKQKLLTNYTYCRLQNLVCTKVFDNSLQLHSFIIEDKYRNQKIGKYVLNYIFKEYDINISNILHLFVLKNNPALNFYLKNHFIVHKKIIGALAMLELKYPGYILVSSI